MKQFINRISLVIVSVILMRYLPVFGQEPLSPTITYPIGHYETLYSNILNEKRTIIVHLPADYETLSKSYPLLFVETTVPEQTETISHKHLLVRRAYPQISI